MHACEVSGQVVFPGKGLHARLRIYALIGSKLTDLLWLDSDIGPKQVPVGRGVIVEFELHLADNALDHVVAAGMRAQNQLLVVFLFVRLRRRGLCHVVLVVTGPTTCNLGVNRDDPIGVIVGLGRPESILDLLDALVSPHVELAREVFARGLGGDARWLLNWRTTSPVERGTIVETTFRLVPSALLHATLFITNDYNS